MIKSAAILKNDKIHTGRRHDLILNAARPFGALKGGQQGFITDDGVFVNRKQAAKIAYACGQIKQPKPVLYSEDYL